MLISMVSVFSECLLVGEVLFELPFNSYRNHLELQTTVPGPQCSPRGSALAT